LPLTPSQDSQGDQEKQDSDDTDDVRYHGNETGNVAGVRPDEADDRSDDKHGDHQAQPIEDPSSGDAAERTPVASVWPTDSRG
jgi:hypothetical protein